MIAFAGNNINNNGNNNPYRRKTSQQISRIQTKLYKTGYKVTILRFTSVIVSNIKFNIYFKCDIAQTLNLKNYIFQRVSPGGLTSSNSEKRESICAIYQG